MPIHLSDAQITTQVLNEARRLLNTAAHLDADEAELAWARACGAFDLWRRLVDDLLVQRDAMVWDDEYDQARLRAMLRLPR
ncbi:hypothetical protein ACS0X5_21665 [Burkholderia gladioli]|uniref:hypothetical protein n=1 Tax=Burkholderia gladioli TaxID=28095 RepID=UPI00030C77E0|nr:hypothetical protein [Burkholderia gladioli]MBW5287734.1 hypothetical protein [Burkholderia gladioli]